MVKLLKKNSFDKKMKLSLLRLSKKHSSRKSSSSKKQPRSSSYDDELESLVLGANLTSKQEARLMVHYAGRKALLIEHLKLLRSAQKDLEKEEKETTCTQEADIDGEKETTCTQEADNNGVHNGTSDDEDIEAILLQNDTIVIGIHKHSTPTSLEEDTTNADTLAVPGLALKVQETMAYVEEWSQEWVQLVEEDVILPFMEEVWGSPYDSTVGEDESILTRTTDGKKKWRTSNIATDKETCNVEDRNEDSAAYDQLSQPELRL